MQNAAVRDLTAAYQDRIVPERAAGVFYIRAATEQRLAALKERVSGCFRAGALAILTTMRRS